MKKFKNKFQDFEMLMIRHKLSNTPWTMKLFKDEEDAYKYFIKTCGEHKWDFKWKDYILEKVSITKIQ